MELSLITEAFTQDDQSWLGSAHGTDATRSITLDTSAFTSGTHYPNGYFPSGLPLGKITASGLYGPYGASPSEVQLQTVGGGATGGTFTLGFDGETTAAITYSAGLTAATIQTALLLLSNVNPGDIVVSGSAGGPYTYTFGGRYAGLDVPLIVTAAGSLTGGTPTNVVTVVTAGGGSSSDGTEVLAGFLFCAVKSPTVNTIDIIAALLDHGKVIAAKLPIAVDAAGQADVSGRIQFV